MSSFALAAGLFSMQFSGAILNRYLAIALLSLLTIPLTLWSLKEALKGAVWLVSWILPFLFTGSVGLFYFLLPAKILVAIPITLIYFAGIYASLLSENIFAVAAVRTIQLLRSASAVSFLLTLTAAFLLYETVFSFRLPFYANALFVTLISFFLFLHGVWSVNLEEKISFKMFHYSLCLSLMVGEIALILSFWPTTVTLIALFLTTLVYVSLGLVQALLGERLFSRTVKEYLAVGAVVLAVLFWYTTWG